MYKWGGGGGGSNRRGGAVTEKNQFGLAYQKPLFAMEQIFPSVSSANIDSDNKTSDLNERSLCAANLKKHGVLVHGASNETTPIKK